ncbi:hypothetical protein CANCADRAFT_40887 [Tortispora caseinolytica NRRL Y-17796]|uniref:Thiamine phosphate synthase/TenI domain-containing protein n=1 Tax=Tortispora caseinolytica NRRL Y-17796 TaxID=767744 RepID=A0A1E4TCF9_9ASCO|nr:hypothetical protein CANCADRAFT_40887 [Tortispora caseinolytica NRRL Y-17796]
MSLVDYGVYLVTDSGLLPPGRSLLQQVESALEGGVTLVQLREKSGDTGEIVQLAIKVKELTDKFNVPLIIDDRVDIALAVDAAGVHVGQTDMDVTTVRRLVGPDKIVGVSCHTVEQSLKAIAESADYLGCGPIYPTKTKSVERPPLGINGLKEIVTAVSKSPRPVPIVAIGGIKVTNVDEVLTAAPTVGVAVVTGIISDPDAKRAATGFLVKVQNNGGGRWCKGSFEREKQYCKYLFEEQETPLVHQIVNKVVPNFAANVTLALKASPIMSECPGDFKALSSVPLSALFLNLGNATEQGYETMLAAGKAYNEANRPIVFDPIGAGASPIRKDISMRLLNNLRLDVIKGNESEILTLAGYDTLSRGVDSAGVASDAVKVEAAQSLAQKLGCVVVISGKMDIVANGTDVYYNPFGSPLLGQVTGSGCCLGTTITRFLTSDKLSTFHAAAAAVWYYTRSSELVENVKGPGTFVPAFIDSLADGSALK